ncbi:MAG: hypothetical protein E7069_02705 [Bacteroidales bacterium]|nr:hypothetical protein [Bacteroidales bacterium]
MKRFALCALIALIISDVAAQKADSTYVKKGFAFGALPAVAYDDDLGFQYGVLTNLYWYGDGSNYPRYNHSLYLECSRYVAGTMLLRAYFDSHTLLPQLRTTADFTWFNDLTLDFYGFNGRKSVYNYDYTDDDHDDYRTRVFYRHARRMARLMLNVRHNYDDKPLFWQAGATIFNMKIGSVDLSKLRDKLPEVETLYDKYVRWGLIDAKEANGGVDTYLRGGFGVDTRDNEAFPTSGVWTEALIAIAPGILSNDNNNWGKLTIYHRQYFDLYNKDLVFAYRVGWQQLLWGEQPFYLLPHWNTSVLTSATSQGIGGAKTMRGIKRNRIVGDGSIMGNAELRYIFTRFMLFGQQFSVGTNLFADFGMVTQEHRVDTQNVPLDEYYDYFSDDSENVHTSAGIGLKVSLNANFVVSADWGKALNRNDGESGVYVQMNYLF